MNYYNEIKEIFVKNEIYKKVKDYSKNRSDLNTYFEVGRLIVEAQGGEARAKYGNKLIKEYSIRLTRELGKGYTERNLRNMRSFYIKFRKWHTVCAELTWSHYRLLLSINDENQCNYYICITRKLNLSVRGLRERIKSKEYERLGKNVDMKKPKKAEYIGQVIKYVNYVDKNIKEVYNEPTVGVIICKKENKYVMEYCTNPNIFVSTYQAV